MTEKKLTRKQKAFCIEYVKDFNGQKAAERAGYSQRTARNTASRLLKIDTIANKIDKHLESLKMDADEALRLLAEKARNADSESVQVRALETIVKVHGLASEKHEGELTFKVIYGNQDTPEDASPETD